MSKNTNVLVIGAGPIGLINAWGMMRLNPGLNIEVLERFPAYKRTHNLVMQAAQLEAIMKATKSEKVPELVKLLARLKKDPHIRTIELQEIFTNLAKASGVKIKTNHRVLPETIKPMLAKEYPNVKLIIGADGTHGVVSPSLFSKENQVKHEFDFVLQLRLEINGKERAPGGKTRQFYQELARKGLVADEFVGHYDEKKGKTPITMQMMISKEDFKILEKAKSGTPIKPFAADGNTFVVDGVAKKAPKIPAHILSFINAYLKNKIQDTEAVGQSIDKELVTISVNEAPATHAKQVITTYENAHVVLEGDSALGLSYFKGLNAGLEASAKFLSTLSSSIRNSFTDKRAMSRQLDFYQKWFLNEFSPKKVKEVSQFSFWQIRSAMKAIETVRNIKESSWNDFDENMDPAVQDYFNHFINDPLNIAEKKQWRPFPHRPYDLVKFGQLSYVPLNYTAKKIYKLFADYFKPYKNTTQLKHDYQQPLFGLAHSGLGLVKILTGIFTLKGWDLADGLFTLLRGVIELVTTPLALVLKPLMRLSITIVRDLIHGEPLTIEENSGIQRLAQYGQEYINETQDFSSENTIYELLAVCNDIHRKFDKSFASGQPTLKGVEEQMCYSEIRADNVLDVNKLTRYFSIFAPKVNIQTGQEELVSLTKIRI